MDQESDLVDKEHSTDKNRSYIKDQRQRVEAYMRNKEKRTGIEGLFNTREVAGIGKAIRDEYFPRPKKVEKEVPEDVKQEEKFEPFYEGEGKQTIEDVVDSDAGSAT